MAHRGVELLEKVSIKVFNEERLIITMRTDIMIRILNICLEDGSAFLNLPFGAVSRSYPLFYLTVKSVQNVGFSVYPEISSKDWTLYLCLPSAKDNFLSHFHCFKQHNCSTSKKEIVQTDFVNK